jgi:Ca2+-binding RTX toxin-like protein
VFDNRGGTLGHAVHGDDGDDIFMVSGQIEIVEGDGVNSGYDRVRATASYTMANNIEELQLLGGKDIKGAGNGDDNVLIGNRGDNRLAGHDMLYGGRCDDVFTGHVGDDVFFFRLKSDGIDRVTDFDDGADLIAIGPVDSQAEFGALEIRQSKGDLMIDLGHGDKSLSRTCSRPISTSAISMRSKQAGGPISAGRSIRH